VAGLFEHQLNKAGIYPLWVIASMTATMETRAAGIRLKVQRRQSQIHPMNFLRDMAPGVKERFCQIMSLGFIAFSIVVPLGCFPASVRATL
jgi:hypothetical protein